MLKVTPLFIIDIRNEFKHVPAFPTLAHYLYYLLDNRNKKFLKFPTSHKFWQDGQFRFTFSSHHEWLKLFDMFQKLRNTTIVVDEADALFSDSKFYRKLLDLVLGARNNNITLYFLTKRPHALDILVRSQADTFIIFGTKEKYDVDYLKDRVGETDFPKDPRLLIRGEAIIFRDGEKPILEKYQKFEGESNL